jgi:hypothetical protein
MTQINWERENNSTVNVFITCFLQPKIQLFVYGICIGIVTIRQRGRVSYV